MSDPIDPAAFMKLSFGEKLSVIEKMSDPASEPILQGIKERLPELEALLKKVSSHWGAEDGFYRFYHQSFKVYQLQFSTEEIVAALRAIAPERGRTNGSSRSFVKAQRTVSRTNTIKIGLAIRVRFLKRSFTPE